MSRHPKNFKEHAFFRLLQVWRRGDWYATAGWLGVCLFLACIAATLLALPYAFFGELDLSWMIRRDSFLWVVLAIFIFAYCSLGIWWIASNPTRRTRLLVGVERARRFKPSLVRLARGIRWLMPVLTTVISLIVLQQTWMWLPRFSRRLDTVNIYVAEFWDPAMKNGKGSRSKAGRTAIIEAINKDKLADAQLRDRVMVAPLDKLISPEDLSTGTDSARVLGRRGRADLVVWGSVLSAERQKYVIRVTPVAKEIALECGIIPHHVLIAKDPCPAELSHAPLVLARFVLAYACYQSEDWAHAISLFTGMLKQDGSGFELSLCDRALLSEYLGTSYLQLWAGDREENVHAAIACYQQTLRVWTKKVFPYQWAKVQHNLGLAYAALPDGDRSNNLRKAIAHLQAALQVLSAEVSLGYWALLQHNLGAMFAGLPTGDRGENSRKAIVHYKAALRVWSRKASPICTMRPR